MSLEISLFMTIDIRKRSPPLLLLLVCASAQNIEAECLAVVTNRGFGGFTIRCLKMKSNVCHEGQVTKCVLQFT